MSLPNEADTRRTIYASLAIFAWLAVLPARAEKIVLVDDGHGHRVYTNIEDPIATAHLKARHLLHSVAPPREIEKLVEQSAQKHQVDPKLVRAIVQVESDYDSRAVSSKGAMGLMQLMPATADRFGVSNPFDPKENIEGGVNYLKYLLDLFKGDVPLSVAAYNAGEHSVLRQGGVPNFPETVNYVHQVESLYNPKSTSAGTKPPNPVTIYRYVDASGVVHYTDGGDL